MCGYFFGKQLLTQSKPSQNFTPAQEATDRMASAYGVMRQSARAP